MEARLAAGDETPAEECAAAAAGCRTNDDDGHGASPSGFDCSVCLEPAAEPVATRCGHLYCRPCVRRWLRSGRPGAGRCPVCKAAVSEDRLVPLYGRRGGGGGGANVEHRPDDGVGEVVRSMGRTQNQRFHRGWVLLHSNAGGAAVAVLPRAFPAGRPPAIARGGRRQRKVEDALHQIWIFLAVSAVLCFLLL
ncbi:hypothetical protein ACP4OV_000105 [Aristida adscensionis]